jgi:hypothetical protein
MFLNEEESRWCKVSRSRSTKLLDGLIVSRSDRKPLSDYNEEQVAMCSDYLQTSQWKDEWDAKVKMDMCRVSTPGMQRIRHITMDFDLTDYDTFPESNRRYLRKLIRERIEQDLDYVLERCQLKESERDKILGWYCEYIPDIPEPRVSDFIEGAYRKGKIHIFYKYANNRK